MSRRKTHEEFMIEVASLVGDEYTFIGRYVTNRTKIDVIHTKCGYKYKLTPIEFIRGKRCPKCARNIRKTHTQFVHEILNLVQSEYTVLSQYKSLKTKIKMRHNKCMHVWEVFPDNFLRGTRCPICKSGTSKGESYIYDYLAEKGISFGTQVRFNDCRGKRRPLPFDFAVFDNNRKISLLIEYDGEFHFKAVPEFGGETEYRERLFYDSKKTEYCEKENIPLIRIPYWEFKNIPKILDCALQRHLLIGGVA